MLTSSHKQTLSLLATVTLEVVPFRAYAPFPELLPFFKCILEVVFCGSVQHRPPFCLNHVSCVKMAVFQFYLQWRNRKVAGDQVRWVRWVGDDSPVVFGKKN
jgi:hypothetical protein